MVATRKAVSKLGGLAAAALFSIAAIAPAHANSAAAAADVTARIADETEITDTESPTGLLSTGNSEFAELIAGWKALDNRELGAVSIPSRKPVDSVRMTSRYGYREDPFAGRRANHKGLDMAGPIGTPIYATADGIVGRSQWVSGYGNYIEINHGGDIQTRYGHMSKLIVGPNERVKRGQLIGLMGSTGRSTGSHLHYEVRIAGQPVNPMPFLSGGDYLLASRDRQTEAQGGPDEGSGDE